MSNPIFAQYTQNLLQLYNLQKNGTLFQHQLSEGAIKSLGWIGFLWAMTKQTYLRVTWQSKRRTHWENQSLQVLFTNNLSYLHDKASQPDNPAKTIKAVDFTRQKVAIIRSITSLLEEHYPHIFLEIERKLKAWDDAELKELPQEFRDLFKELQFSGVNSESIKNFPLQELQYTWNSESQKILHFCLKIAPKVQPFLDKLKNKEHPTQLTYLIDMEELKAILKITKAVYQLIGPYHAMHNENFGKVEHGDGVLLPTLEQLKGAFTYGNDYISQKFKKPMTAEGTTLLARLIQVIMCGESVDQIHYPQDEFCFSIKDCVKTKHKIKLPETYENIFECQIKSHSSFKINQDQATGKLEALKDYIRQFFLDLPRSRPIHHEGEIYHMPSDAKNFFENVREGYYKRLLSGGASENAIQNNLTIALACGYSGELSLEQFKNLLDLSLPLAKDLTAFASFEDKQLDILCRKATIEPTDEYKHLLDAQLRNHWIQLMLLLNHSTFGIRPEDFGDMPLNLPSYKLKAAIKGVSIAENQVEEGTYYSLSNMSFQSRKLTNYGIPENEASERRIDVPTEETKVLIPLVRLERRLKIPELEPKPGKKIKKAVLYNYSQPFVRLQSLQLLDEIFAAFK